MSESARALREVRAQREHPGVDDKRLTAWNALMVSALADAGAVLGREDYLAAAVDSGGLRAARTASTATDACCAPTVAAGRPAAPTSRTTASSSRPS